MTDNDYVLTHEEALELLAFLISSAQVCYREPYRDGPYRLISAAAQLAATWAPRTVGIQAEFLNRLSDNTKLVTSNRHQDPSGFERYLAECAQELAGIIKDRREDGDSD